MEPETFDIDDHVLITLRDGNSFEGTVFEYCQVAQRICLKNVTQHPGNINIGGLRGFEGYEISSIKHVGSRKLENDSKYEKEGKDMKIYKM